jgi:hypothetical protein
MCFRPPGLAVALGSVGALGYVGAADEPKPLKRPDGAAKPPPRDGCNPKTSCAPLSGGLGACSPLPLGCREPSCVLGPVGASSTLPLGETTSPADSGTASSKGFGTLTWSLSSRVSVSPPILIGESRAASLERSATVSMANPCKVVSTSQTSGAYTSETYQVRGFWREQMILPGFTVCRLVSQTMLESEPVLSDLLQNFREVGSIVGVER